MHLDLDGEPLGQRLNPDRGTPVPTRLLTEDRDEKLRRAVENNRHLPEVVRAGDEPEHLDHLTHPVQRAERGAGLGEQVQHAVPGGRPGLLERQVGADPPGPPVGALPSQEQQVTGADHARTARMLETMISSRVPARIAMGVPQPTFSSRGFDQRTSPVRRSSP